MSLRMRLLAGAGATRTSRTHRPPRLLGLLLALSLLLVAGCGGDGATEDADTAFYAGETLVFLIPFNPGGGADSFARLMARYLEEHLGEEATVLPENVPGGGTREGFNQYARDHGDGYKIITSVNTTITNQVLGEDGVDYDINDLRPVFAYREGHVVYTAADSGYGDISSIATAEEEVYYGGTAPTGGDQMRLLGLEMLGVQNLRGLFGYDGSGPSRAALLRGEIDVTADSTAAYLSEVQVLEDSGDIIPLATLGLMIDGEIERDPALPDLPTFPEAYEEVHGQPPSGEDYEIYRALLAITNLNRIIWVHREAPEEAYEALVSAFEGIVADPAFEEEANTVLGLSDVDGIMVGDEEIEAALAIGIDQLEKPEMRDWLMEFTARFE